MLEKQLLNKIKWDKKLQPSDYTVTYLDFGREKDIGYNDIIDWEGRFFRCYINDKIAEIPMHRIKKIKKRGTVIWSRT